MVALIGIGDFFLNVYFVVVFDLLITSVNQARAFTKRPGQPRNVLVWQTNQPHPTGRI